MFNFISYSNEQSKQYINSEHLYSIYLQKKKEKEEIENFKKFVKDYRGFI